MVHVILFLVIKSVLVLFRLLLSAVCVNCPVWLFAVFPRIRAFFRLLLRYCLDDFVMLPAAPLITDISFVSTFHVRCISVVGLYISEPS